jgi:hypothetical protein
MAALRAVETKGRRVDVELNSAVGDVAGVRWSILFRARRPLSLV